MCPSWSIPYVLCQWCSTALMILQMPWVLQPLAAAQISSTWAASISWAAWKQWWRFWVKKTHWQLTENVFFKDQTWVCLEKGCANVYTHVHLHFSPNFWVTSLDKALFFMAAGPWKYVLLRWRSQAVDQPRLLEMVIERERAKTNWS